MIFVSTMEYRIKYVEFGKQTGRGEVMPVATATRGKAGRQYAIEGTENPR